MPKFLPQENEKNLSQFSYYKNEKTYSINTHNLNMIRCPCVYLSFSLATVYLNHLPMFEEHLPILGGRARLLLYE